METSQRYRLLRSYLILNTAVLSVLAIGAFRGDSEPTKFEEIDVERINVIEKDGQLRLVIANRERSPGLVLKGETYGQPGNRPGLIFYNDEGVENGGLIFGGKKQNDDYQAGASLTFDQYNQDQVVALQYIDRNGKRFQGLTILDRPDLPLWEVVEREEYARNHQRHASTVGPEEDPLPSTKVRSHSNSTRREMISEVRLPVSAVGDPEATILCSRTLWLSAGLDAVPETLVISTSRAPVPL